MNIGIFSGSFNPVHAGHLILANYITEYTDVEEVWFLVTPQNPLKKMVSMADENDRLEMVRLAVADYPKMKASDFEFSLSRPSYTVNTLEALSLSYPQHAFHFIIGGDNWINFTNWKDYSKILQNYGIYIYPRLGARVEIDEQYTQKVTSLDSPIIEISSSFIREGISHGKNLRAFLPLEVNEYIEKNGLYKG